MVPPKSPEQRRRPHGDFLLGRRGLRGCRYHRQSRSWFHHHEYDDGWHSVDCPDSPTGHQSPELSGLPDNRRLFRGWSELAFGFGQCRIRLEPPDHSIRGCWPQRHFLWHAIRLHGSRLRHLREPGHHRHGQCRRHMVQPHRAHGSRHFDRSLVRECCDVSRRERLRQFVAQHPRNQQWRRFVDR